MLVNFNEVFYSEMQWKDKKLTSMRPCNNCEVYKEYNDNVLYGNIAERQYASLPDSCRTCIPNINWNIDCMRKLQWYEDHDENLIKRRTDTYGINKETRKAVKR